MFTLPQQIYREPRKKERKKKIVATVIMVPLLYTYM
jgi:hypothetical protein